MWPVFLYYAWVAISCVKDIKDGPTVVRGLVANMRISKEIDDYGKTHNTYHIAIQSRSSGIRTFEVSVDRYNLFNLNQEVIYAIWPRSRTLIRLMNAPANADQRKD